MEESDFCRVFTGSAVREDAAGGVEESEVLGNEGDGGRTVRGGWDGDATDRGFAALGLGVFAGSTTCENTETDGIKN